ncbi:hypothetical protein BC826DRAFT_173311 [Russula brevipes]|nr:hypothetical protein BC826DRAFT_173311 [Russula brevipes]
MAELNGVNGTTCDAEQYQQFVSSRDSPSPSISCLTRRESIGLVLAAEASSLSFVFWSSYSSGFVYVPLSSAYLSSLTSYIQWNVRWYRKKFPKRGRKLFERPFDIYMLFLFVFDCIQAIGGMLNIWWAHIGIVRTGPYCTVQGITQQTGELGVALITLILAIHTFVAALWPVGQRACGFAFCMVALTWVFIALWVGIGAGIHKNYETPTPYWCWISPQYPGERLAGEYIWLWAALFASVILYIPLHFWAKGRLSVHEERWWRLYVSSPSPDIADEYPQRRAALGMLSYPAAYTVIVLPITIARWSLFTHHDVTSAVTFSLSRCSISQVPLTSSCS